MIQSNTIAKLSTALAKAQAEMPAAKMNAENPFLHNKYADLGSIIEAAKPILAKNELAVSQLTEGDGSSVGVTTILTHASGEWIGSTVSLPLGDEKGKSQAQVAGSIISYLRRYSLASIIGIYADEDTDGNQGSGQSQQRKPAQKPTQKPPDNGNGQESEPLMTMDMAKTITNSEGKTYISLTDDKLSHMSRSIIEALKRKDLTDEQRTEFEMKRDAIKVILKARAEAEIPA